MKFQKIEKRKVVALKPKGTPFGKKSKKIQKTGFFSKILIIQLESEFYLSLAFF